VITMVRASQAIKLFASPVWSHGHQPIGGPRRGVADLRQTVSASLVPRSPARTRMGSVSEWTGCGILDVEQVEA
jgi:hypothetical protein